MQFEAADRCIRETRELLLKDTLAVNQAIQSRSEVYERERAQNLAFLRKIYGNLSNILDPNSAQNRPGNGNLKQYETVKVAASTAGLVKHKKGEYFCHLVCRF